MQVTIKYKCIGLRGNLFFIKKSIVCPDFEDKSHSIKTNVGEFNFTESKDSQVIDWLDNQDKFDFMAKNGIHTIVDYEVVAEKEKKDKKTDDHQIELYKSHGVTKNKEIKVFSLLYNALNETESEHKQQLLIDFIAIYKRLKDSISPLTVEKQASIIMEASGIAYESEDTAMEFSPSWAEKKKKKGKK